LYDLAGNVVTELSATGGWNRTEIYAGGKHVATYSNSTTYFDHVDWLGTERARTDAQGDMAETCTGLPYGDGLSCTGASDISFMHFTGKEHDTESNLDNFGARYFSSQVGRFMTPDSMAYSGPLNPQSWNLYAYARNNPLLYVDPAGNTVSLANCQNKDQCAQVLAKAAMLPKGVTAGVDKKGNLVLKGDLSKIKGGNALRLLQLVQSDKTANFWIGDWAPAPEGGASLPVGGGFSGVTDQGYNQNFAVVQSDPSTVDSGDLSGVFLGPDGSITPGNIPGTDIEEAAAHELLGHVWADLLGGARAGTASNLREALIAEDRVRNTDPSRGLKIYHQQSVELIRVSDLPRITNPGNKP
jgi:RHS repeat-associated protein